MSELRLIAERIKRRVSVRTVAGWFGFDYHAKGERARYPCPICHEMSHSKATVSIFESNDVSTESWHCFSCDTGGDCISWLAARLDCAPYQSIQRLAAMIGVVVDDDAIIGFMTDEIKGKLVAGVAADGRAISSLRAVRAVWWKNQAKWRHDSACNTESPSREFCKRLALCEYFESRAREGDAGAATKFAEIVGTCPFIPESAATLDMRNLAERYFGEVQKNTEFADYIASRGWNKPETGGRFHIGCCPDGYEPRLSNTESETLREYGVCHSKRGGGYRHAMEGRVVFPIRSLSGRVVGFAGRSLSDDRQPKYLNTSDTALFRKKTLLYGLYENRLEITTRRRVIVTEGYADVVAMSRMGSRLAVASMGTSLTPDHAELLSRIADEVVLMLDGDKAGTDAMERAVDVLRSTRYSLSIATLPEGRDPDDCSKSQVLRAIRDRRYVDKPKTGPSVDWLERLLIQA